MPSDAPSCDSWATPQPRLNAVGGREREGRCQVARMPPRFGADAADVFPAAQAEQLAASTPPNHHQLPPSTRSRPRPTPTVAYTARTALRRVAWATRSDLDECNR